MSTSTTELRERRSAQPPRGGDTVVAVEHLRKSYGAKVAVADVSFEVRRGEIFGILGPNGAGKTTTVETLAGLREANGGSISVLGVDPNHDPGLIRQQVGVQLQESRMPAKMTVMEALRMYAGFYPSPAEPKQLLRRLNLLDKANSRFGDLSGGQKQRLSIALALVGNPQIAILDELTTGLDPQARRDTWDLIEQVRDEGVTILLVTHFMDEAERLCDNLVIIDGGRVVAQGSPLELTRRHDSGRSLRMRLPTQDPAVLETLGRLPEVDTARAIGASGEIEVHGSERLLAAVVLALDSHHIVPDDLRTTTKSLEDVFVDLVKQQPEEAS